ncbi:SulP family inorganic anion transporter [Enterovibrio sp. ZSDZ35]|uniref:SulP family inorganic anion transporter n=1 Tax=Enterovibrio qingdaonensis TaxID=2899818 RepID=A0ABT5QNT5_9GAMM|nr:SulP family inorganic anion transporter [Enterovibrio sp. ZSDZ35]MDD1782650.1 SulP family inorganic anion transporter [Enterovibrio sp. ZSDZ35]
MTTLLARMPSRSLFARAFPFLRWLPLVTKQDLKADLIAGLTGAIIVLPQGVAYAMIAGMPAEYGLYTCIVPAIIAALFGSSHHLISGATAALSVIVFTTVSQFAAPGSPLFIQLALTLTLCAGVVQLLMGLMRFGAVVNFVSHSVVLGFTAGAAVVIAISQLKHLLGLSIESGSTAIENLQLTFGAISQTDSKALLIGIATIAISLTIKHIWPKGPHMLIAMVGATLLALGIGDVALVGAMPNSLPSFSVPVADVVTVERMAMGIIAVALLGLVEAISIARSVAMKSGQLIDANQEFIGQGLSNMIGAFFSCYVSSGSFTRSGVNYTSGARTPCAAIFAALFLTLILLFFAPYAAYIPIAGMAGILFVVAYNLIDIPHILDIFRTDKKESLVLVATFVAAMLLHLELSIYVGMLLSLFFYLRRTSRPTIEFLDPRVFNVPENLIPETAIVRINGSVFYGSCQHLQRGLQACQAKHLIILGRGINFIDYTGAQMLADLVNRKQQTFYFCHMKATPLKALLAPGFAKTFSSLTFYKNAKEALAVIMHT